MSLATPRATNEMLSARHRMLPVAANAKIWQGTLVILNAGVAQPGSAVAAAVTMGIAEFTADNTGGIAGAVSVSVKRGVFSLASDPADPVLPAQIGSVCYVLDDQTVSATSAAGAKPVAGRVFNIDSDGSVWVEIL